MTESKRNIEIASSHSDIDSLRKKAQGTGEPEPQQPPAEDQGKERKGFSNVVGEVAKDLGMAAAGAAGYEFVEHFGKTVGHTVAQKTVEAIGGVGAGKGNEPPEEPLKGGEKESGERLGKRSFMEIQNELTSLIDKTPNRDREDKLKLERGRLVNVAKGAGIFDTLQSHLLDIQGEFGFDRSMLEIRKINVDSLESEMSERYHDWDDKMKGMLSEYRDVALLNMELAYQRAQDRGGSIHAKKLEREIDLRGWGLPPVGLESAAKKYLESLAPKNENDVESLRPPRPEPIPQRTHPETRQSLREIPLYFGAVFRGGKNEVYVDRSDLIPTLDIDNATDRDLFVFKNLHAFNFRFGNGAAWEGAEGDWIKDFNLASEVVNISMEDRDKFIEKLNAMMAVTASARAMEDSEGVTKTYLKNLLGSDERGEPKLGKQDLAGSMLLHDHPEKIVKIFEDPLVKHYYDRVMRDAGLVSDEDHEWHEIVTPDGKKSWVASHLEFFDNDPEANRTNNLLVKYMKDEAKEGGLDKYIEKILLESDSPDIVRRYDDGSFGKDIKLAAAKLATDVFLVDKFTRWSDAMTEHGKVSMKLQPKGDWGGDPLASIINPTALPKIKGVYTGKELDVLNFVGPALKPDYIFNQIQRDKEYDDASKSKVHTLIPSMVTNAKYISRLADVNYKVYGDSMATGLANWDRKMMEEELPKIADLLTQVYGGLKVKEKKSDKEIPIGKHIVGAMMMRLLYAKAYAATLESARPGAGDIMSIIFDPENRDKPFLDVMHFLYGIKNDARSGFIYSLKAGRTELVIGRNKFDAEKFFDATYNLLATNDQSGGNYAGVLNKIGKAFNILSAIGEGMGVTKSR